MGDPSPNQAELLRAYLAGRDIPCPGCGYNLRGLTIQTCPECGLFLHWPLRKAGSSVGWRLGLAAMICTYAALAVVALTTLLGNILVGGIAILFLLEAPRRVRRWIRDRRAFIALPRHTRQQMIAGWWLAAAVAGVLVGASMHRP